MLDVPMARIARNALGSPGKNIDPNKLKKKALSPKAARGKAVAVPL